ncbi:MAG: M48 family metalloprotease [Gammaproteobacteria bacterium]
MDFFGRQDRARRTSRWLVLAFAVAVGAVALAVNLIVLLTVAILNAPGPGAFLHVGDWFDAHPATVWLTTLLVVGGIVGSSLWKILQMRAGGRVVARDLGARLVSSESDDPLLHTLRNVVEEMAIAASVPVPSVYILESPAINALAAGYAPAEASLLVTRGALLALDRNELQGVIGHEFSHIVNGDMRLNTRLVGFLYGLFVVSALGRWLGPGIRKKDGKRRNGGLGLAGTALFVVGLAGLFMGRLLQAAVARERERLADASAVQFTRESRGLRNALVKVGSHRIGSRLNHPGIDRVSHMLFASAGYLDFATHPPLRERIRALDPTFQSAEFGRMRYILDAREAACAAEAGGSAVKEEAAPNHHLPLTGALTVAPAVALSLAATVQAVTALVGNPGPEQIEQAATMHRALPADVLMAARDPVAAQSLLLAIALGSRDRTERLAYLQTQLGPDIAAQLQAVLPTAEQLPIDQRLPAVLLLLGTLRQWASDERRQLVTVISGLITRAGAPTVFGYALRKCTVAFLQESVPMPGSTRFLPLRAVRDDLRLVLSIVARCGVGDAFAPVDEAFDAGWVQLELRPATPVSTLVTSFDEGISGTGGAWTGGMDRALARLDRLAYRDKQRVIRAMTAAIAHNGQVNVPEAELLRLFCALLHCPLPALTVRAARDHAPAY